MSSRFTAYLAWVNQPSTLQAYHKFHGKTGVAVEELETGTVLFCLQNSDSVTSFEVPKAVLAKGSYESAKAYTSSLLQPLPVEVEL